MASRLVSREDAIFPDTMVAVDTTQQGTEDAFPDAPPGGGGLSGIQTPEGLSKPAARLQSAGPGSRLHSAGPGKRVVSTPGEGGTRPVTPGSRISSAAVRSSQHSS